MPPVVAIIRSILSWAAVGVITVAYFIVLLPLTIVTWPFDRKKAWPHWIAVNWARSLLSANPACKVTVEGEHLLEKIGGEGASVLCANHESMADIIALYYLGHPFKWIAKRSLFFIPCVGWAMWFAGYIPLRRGNRDSIAQCMEAARTWLRGGVSIMMFPEGTRSPDGRVKPFKDGAFRLAVDTDVPIVPIALVGPRGLLEKGSWLFAARSRMVVRVGEPIRPRGKGAVEVERLKRETRVWILKNLAEITGMRVDELDASGEPAAPMTLGNTGTG